MGTIHDRPFLNTLKGDPPLVTVSRTPNSEIIRQFKYDHHLAKPGGARLHADQPNMRTRVVHVANGQSTEISHR